jgi:hypothetical protein
VTSCTIYLKDYTVVAEGLSPEEAFRAARTGKAFSGRVCIIVRERDSAPLGATGPAGKVPNYETMREWAKRLRLFRVIAA